MRNLSQIYSDKIMGGPLLGVHIFLFFLCEGLHPVAQNSLWRKDSVRHTLFYTTHVKIFRMRVSINQSAIFRCVTRIIAISPVLLSMWLF